MARLISADDLIERAYRLRLDDREQVAQMIESAPTVDAVPVVRCRECIYRNDDKMCEYKTYWVIAQDDNDFCSWGKREDGKTD